MQSPNTLTDAQLTLLSAASQRDDRRVMLPDRLRGKAADKLLATLMTRGLIEPVSNDSDECQPPAANIAGLTNYCISEGGMIAIGAAENESDAALAPGSERVSVTERRSAMEVRIGAISSKRASGAVVHQESGSDCEADVEQGAVVDNVVCDRASQPVKRAPSQDRGGGEPAFTSDASSDHSGCRAPRQGSKLDRLVAILSSAEGATIDDLTRATGWLPHTARAAVTGLRRRGYEVCLDRASGRRRSTYRILSPRTDAIAS